MWGSVGGDDADIVSEAQSHVQVLHGEQRVGDAWKQEELEECERDADLDRRANELVLVHRVLLPEEKSRKVDFRAVFVFVHQYVEERESRFVEANQVLRAVLLRSRLRSALRSRLRGALLTM